MDRVESWRCRAAQRDVCYATFNWDTLLEDAFGACLHRQFSSLDDYVSGSKTPLIKLHGSVGWTRRVKGMAGFELSEADALARALEGTLVLEDDFARGDQGFPALAIPVTGKREFWCPRPHLEVLRAYLPKVRAILTIGWRAADAHVVEMLAKSVQPGARLFVVANGADDGRAIGKRLRAISPGFRVADVAGFSRFLGSGLLDDFLNELS